MTGSINTLFSPALRRAVGTLCFVAVIGFVCLASFKEPASGRAAPVTMETASVVRTETVTQNCSAYVSAQTAAKVRSEVKAAEMVVKVRSEVKAAEMAAKVRSEVKAAEMAARRRRLLSACSALPRPLFKPQRVNTILAPKVGAAYCDVPKVGSSFLKRIFFVLQHKGIGANPLEMGGELVHLYMPSIKRDFSNMTTNIMFARDPFSKIYSAHIDKCFLMPIPQLSAMIYIQKTKNYSMGNDKIPRELHLPVLNISFSDTIEYATGATCAYGKANNGCPNDHFKSVSYFCDVCNQTYHVVGKMETFNADVEFFLDSINRSDVYKAMGNVDTNNHVEIVTDVINRIMGKFMLDPLVEVEDAFCELLYRRAWKVFQMRGFIADLHRFPDDVKLACGEHPGVRALTEHAAWAVRASRDTAALRRQKHRYFLAAFRSVPLSVLRKYQDSVRSDCALFDYNCNNTEIFQGRREGDEERNVFSDVSVSLDAEPDQ